MVSLNQSYAYKKKLVYSKPLDYFIINRLYF